MVVCGTVPFPVALNSAPATGPNSGTSLTGLGSRDSVVMTGFLSRSSVRFRCHDGSGGRDVTGRRKFWGERSGPGLAGRLLDGGVEPVEHVGHRDVEDDG